MKALKLFLQIIIFIGLKLKEFFTSENWIYFGQAMLFVIGFSLSVMIIIFLLGLLGAYILPFSIYERIEDINRINATMSFKQKFDNIMGIGVINFGVLFFGTAIVGCIVVAILSIKKNWYRFERFIKDNWKEADKISKRILK